MTTYSSAYSGTEIDAAIGKTGRIEEGTYTFNASPTVGDWRIRKNSTKKNMVERMDTTNNWVSYGTFGGSIESDHFVLENKGGSVYFLDSSNDKKIMATSSRIDEGVALGCVEAGTSLVHNGRLESFQAGSASDQGTRNNGTDTLTSVTSRTFSIAGYTTNLALATIKFTLSSVPANTKMRISVSSLDFENVSSFDFVNNAMGESVSNGEVTYSFNPCLRLVKNTAYDMKVEFSNAVTLTGSGSGAGFNPKYSVTAHPVTKKDVMILPDFETARDAGSIASGSWIFEGGFIYQCNVTGTQTGTFASNASKWDKLGTMSASDMSAEEIAIAFNAKNNRSGSAIPAGSLVFFVDNIVENAGVKYLEVEYEKGSDATITRPDGYVPTQISADGYLKDGVIVKGGATITSTQITNSALPKKLYVEQTGSGNSTTWRFTETSGTGKWYVGTILESTANANEWDVFLDFSLIQAHEHADSIDEHVDSVSFDINDTIRLGRSVGSDLTATIKNRAWQAPVNSIVNTPPSASLGDRVIVGSAPTLTFSGNTNKIAEYDSTNNWTFVTPQEGDAVYVKSTDALVTYNGTKWERLADVGAQSNGTDVTGNFNTLNFKGDHHKIVANSTDSTVLDIDIDPGSMMLRNGSGSTTFIGQPMTLGADSSGNEVALSINAPNGDYPSIWANGEIANGSTGEFIRTGIISGTSNVEESASRRQTVPSTAGTALYWRADGGTFSTVVDSRFFIVGSIKSSSYRLNETTTFDASLVTGSAGISTGTLANSAKNHTIVVKSNSHNNANFQIPDLQLNQEYTTPFAVGDQIAFSNPVAGKTLNINIQPGGLFQNASGGSITAKAISSGQSIVIERIAGNIWKIVHENDRIVVNDVVVSLDRILQDRSTHIAADVFSAENNITNLTNDARKSNKGFLRGFRTYQTADDQVTITPGECGTDDGQEMMVVSSNIVADIDTHLDTGSEAASTWYFIWLMRGSTSETDVIARFSTSSTAPTMPGGYTRKRLIGAVYNNSSSNFRPFTTRGEGSEKRYSWTLEELTASNLNVSSRTAISCSAVVPNMPWGYPLIEVTAERNDSGGNLLFYNADQTSSTMNFIGPGTSHATVPYLELNSSGQFHISNSSSNVSGVYIKVIGFDMSL